MSSGFRAHAPHAADGGGAARVGGRASRRAALWGLALLTVGAVGCASERPAERERRPAEPSIWTASPPSQDERYCAWYGDRGGDVLYFGASAFWSAFRESGGNPEADLDAPGPVLLGRFDLAGERLLSPVEIQPGLAPAGIWDVLAHESGRIFFTSFFDASGWWEPETGRVERLPALGAGLNELAPGPDGGVLVSRYGAAADGRAGSVLVLDAEGEAQAEHPIAPPSGYTAAPKTVAWDPGRREIWVTTDLLPDDEQDAGGAGDIRHDAYVLAEDGRELRRIARPEIHFVVFAPDGAGYAAEVDGAVLSLRRIPPVGEEPGALPERLVLDEAFPADLDFAQDVKTAGPGRVVVSRWSGVLHVADFARAEVRSPRLPHFEPEGLYYTAVLVDGRLCATYCADVSVVCRDAP